MPPSGFLHNHADFPDLLRIVGRESSIDPGLVEKDYWIMHCLYGLQQLGMPFQLKGGTSLSKGFGIIKRFSEDIDIQIEPPKCMDVKIGKNHTKPAHRESRKRFYDSLEGTIEIDGIENVSRDTEFDDVPQYRSGGIRLEYSNTTTPVPGLKDGVLLEVGFDNVTPNSPQDISSWAYDYAAATDVQIIDNRAMAVYCYHPGYTLVEKLQTISTKYRRQQEDGSLAPNFLRHYYDVYCLLDEPNVQDFIGTPEYCAHKEERFRPGDNQVIAQNEAFLLSDSATQSTYEEQYSSNRALYYADQPSFDDILGRIREHAGGL